MNERYRAISWWLDWNDMMWPDQAIIDKIRRRADQAANSKVNCVMIFGMHFRWDHMPLWDRLHDMLAYTVEELHARQIAVFDHHSAVLTHRPRSRADAWDIYRRNRHHVPFYPSLAAAASWTFEGQPINDWRMIDVETGQAAYLPTYTAEQFCLNNPHFRSAYQSYVRKLLRETGIDGLMSDDCIHYGGWRTCACRWCRERFLSDYGHELPAISETSFWGNRDSEAFKDWIAMRFADSGGFLKQVKAALPEGFPLLSCCSTSDYAAAPSSGLTYQEYIKHCSMVMLEMCGSTPNLEGTWHSQMASQMLHLAIARDSASPCLGLGYGFYPDSAFFIWALNKFLGGDTWFSTLPGRLAGPPEQIASLGDDPELVAEAFRWEHAHPELFQAQSAASAAVFFSRATRDYYGQSHQDYTLDYHLTCSALVDAAIDFGVATNIPTVDQWPVLVLGCAVCLSQDEIAALESYLQSGGRVVAFGPTALRDERAHPSGSPWLEQYNIRQQVEEPQRIPGFPPYAQQIQQPAHCSGSQDETVLQVGNWAEVRIGKGKLCWSPGRPQLGGAAFRLAEKLTAWLPKQTPLITQSPAGWALRRFTDDRQSQQIYLYGLPRQVVSIPHPTISNAFAKESIVEHIQYTALDGQTLALQFEHSPASIQLYSPDLAQPRAIQPTGSQVTVDLSGIRRFFVLQIRLSGDGALV